MKETLNTDQAPKAIGPYSQAVRANGLLFLSGQIPLDPATGMLVNSSIADQTSRVLQNIHSVLKHAGVGLEAVVKTTVFLKDMGTFAEMNEVYAQYFISEPPARSTVEVSRLPRGVDVEIEVIAIDRANS